MDSSVYILSLNAGNILKKVRYIPYSIYSILHDYVKTLVSLNWTNKQK